MSPSNRITHSASAVMVIVGTLAIVASFAIGMTGWPPSRATAATEDSAVLLGVSERSVTRVPAQATLTDKFGDSAVATATVVTSKVLSAHRLRRDTRPRSVGFASKSSGTGSGWQSAVASWYGPGFYGRPMAGGGLLRRDSMIVAHKTLAFGTRVQFVYRGRMVTAVVRDRGPFIAGRTFDLGPGTARVLGFDGVGTVKYRIIGK